MPINLPDKSSRRDDDGNILKRRLLGAAVMIALAVIFLPLLLDGSGSESRFRRVEQLRVEPPRILDQQGKLETTVPKPVPKPETNVSTTATTDAENARSKVEKILNDNTKSAAETEQTHTDETPVAKTPTDKTPADKTQAPVSNPVTDKIENNVAWVVQAASFTEKSNALALRDELRIAQFPAYVSTIKGESKQVYRVKVGPITDREQAVKVQKKVETQFQLKTLIRQYQ